MNILQRIFTDYYEEIKYTLHPRDSEMENIDKMLNCGDPSFGGAMYVCTTCHNMKFVPFRCKSRFCPTCGVKYSQERSTSMAFKLVNCTHRHCVFTIDEELRHFFLEDRSLLNCLFRAVQSVILHMFNKINKSQNFVPGFICVLHTFGRPLEWNPHIHCILSESGIHKSKHRFSLPCLPLCGLFLSRVRRKSNFPIVQKSRHIKYLYFMCLQHFETVSFTFLTMRIKIKFDKISNFSFLF